MSIDEADEIMRAWDKKQERSKDFISRMERKLHRKERFGSR